MSMRLPAFAVAAMAVGQSMHLHISDYRCGCSAGLMGIPFTCFSFHLRVPKHAMRHLWWRDLTR